MHRGTEAGSKSSTNQSKFQAGSDLVWLVRLVSCDIQTKIGFMAFLPNQELIS